MNNKPKFSDLGGLSMEAQVETIGIIVTMTGKVCGAIVDNNEKADRFVACMKQHFPAVHLQKRAPMHGNTILLRFGPPPHNS